MEAIRNLQHERTRALSEMKKTKKQGELRKIASSDEARAGGHDEEEKNRREEQQVLAAMPPL